MHILSVYIFQVGVNQQLYGQACSYWMRGLHDGATITIIFAVENCSAETWTNFDD